MLGFLWRMLVGRFKSHEHKMEIIETIALVNIENIPVGQKYILQCTTCGDLFSRKF